MWHGGVGRAWREEISTYYSHDVLSRLMAALDARAARVAEEVDVEAIDVRPLLEPSVETYYDFFHATPAGATVVARTVAAVVVREPLAVEPGLTAPRAS